MFTFKCPHKNDSDYPSDYKGNQLHIGDTVEYDPGKVGDIWGSHQVATITEILKKNDSAQRNWRVMVEGSVLDECEILYFRWMKINSEDANA